MRCQVKPFVYPRRGAQPWAEYERRKGELQDLPPTEYEAAIRKLTKELGL